MSSRRDAGPGSARIVYPSARRRRLVILNALATLAGTMLPGRGGAQGERRRVGILSIGAPYDPASEGLMERDLARRGLVEGRNLVIERRFAHGDTTRLPSLAAELVALRPEVIFTIGGTPAARAAKAATDRIPIVFEVVSEPVEKGLVASLSRPGGLITGSALYTRNLDAKRMQLLSDTLSKPVRLAVLDMARTTAQRSASVDPFPTLPGVTYELFETKGAPDIEDVFQRIVRWRATGLVVMHTPTTSTVAPEITRLALQHRLPAIADGHQFGQRGLMLTYTTNMLEAFERGGEYVARILAGERPADLPVVQVSRYELLVNRKTAAALGVRISNALLAQATQVID